MEVHTDGPTSNLLPSPVAVQLAHALIQNAADDEGIRVIFIKGPVADHHRLREPRDSSDVDVLVDPLDQVALVRALGRGGWRVRPASLAHERFITHSVNLMHAEWPCDIDIHDSYPGFFADPSAAFTVASSRTERLALGGRVVSIADFELSALIAALHSLRSPYSERHSNELFSAVAEVKRRLCSGEVSAADLVALAVRLDGAEVLEPFFRRLDIEVEIPEPRSHDYALWRLRAGQRSRLASWLVEIADAPARERLGLALRALIPPRLDMVVDHPRSGRSWRQLILAHIARYRDGVHAIPAALRAFRAERASLRAERASGDAVARSVIGGGLLPVLHADGAVGGRERAAALVAARPLESVPDEVRAPGPPLSESPAQNESLEATAWSEERSSNGPQAELRFRQADEVAQIRLDDEVFVLPRARHSSGPLRLVGSALVVWETLTDAGTLPEVVEAVSRAYEAEPSAIAADIALFVERLSSLELLVSAP